VNNMLEQVRKKRQMPFLQHVREVDGDGERGVITRGNTSLNKQVRFNGEKHAYNCHPTWEKTSYDHHGNIIADDKITERKEMQQS
jgi:hypothetical protein